MVKLAAEPVVFWFNVGTSLATIARNVGVPAEPLGAARNVLAVCDEKLLGVTDNVPPKVRLPELVTVPVRVNPDTVPVPPTEVTVPLFNAVIVGFPETPSPLEIEIPVPAVIVLAATVPDPVLAIKPFVPRL